MSINFAHLLLGKDLRSIGRSNEVVLLVQDQKSFDELFVLLFHHERHLAMRAADAIEKITIEHPEFIQPHKTQLLSLFHSDINIELKWHLAQLITRVELSSAELREVWLILQHWCLNPNESKVVRVNALQSLFDLSQNFPEHRMKFQQVLLQIEHEPIPSIQARIKKLKRKL